MRVWTSLVCRLKYREYQEWLGKLRFLTFPLGRQGSGEYPWSIKRFSQSHNQHNYIALVIKCKKKQIVCVGHLNDSLSIQVYLWCHL